MPATKNRRALSTVAAPGRIGSDGDPRIARGLAEALADARDKEIAESLTHPLHTYPARMHPATARRLIDGVMRGVKPGAPLVDPFCGSGTVLVEARHAGLRAIGIDLSPLAVMIARAKTWTVEPKRRRLLKDLGHRITGEVLAAGKQARRAGYEQPEERRPEGFDPNARNRRVQPWFAPHVRRELEDIAARIDTVRGQDAELGDVLTVCLSAILYKVSFRASDTDPRKVQRTIARGMAARLFAQRVELLVAGLHDLAHRRAPPPEVLLGDSRRLGEVVPDGTAGGIVTSPPYAGTYDYAETQRLRFDFLGIRHRDFDEGEIGARRGFGAPSGAGPGGRERAQRASLGGTSQEPREGTERGVPRSEPRLGGNPFAKWRDDLAGVIGGMAAALARGSYAALVIGDSLAAGRAMRADEDVRAALDDRLAMVAWAWQDRPMLGAAERRGFGDRPKREHILLLERL